MTCERLSPSHTQVDGVPCSPLSRSFCRADRLLQTGAGEVSHVDGIAESRPDAEGGVPRSPSRAASRSGLDAPPGYCPFGPGPHSGTPHLWIWGGWLASAKCSLNRPWSLGQGGLGVQNLRVACSGRGSQLPSPCLSASCVPSELVCLHRGLGALRRAPWLPSLCEIWTCSRPFLRGRYSMRAGRRSPPPGDYLRHVSFLKVTKLSRV